MLRKDIREEAKEQADQRCQIGSCGESSGLTVFRKDGVKGSDSLDDLAVMCRDHFNSWKSEKESLLLILEAEGRNEPGLFDGKPQSREEAKKRSNISIEAKQNIGKWSDEIRQLTEEFLTGEVGKMRGKIASSNWCSVKGPVSSGCGEGVRS